MPSHFSISKGMVDPLSGLCQPGEERLTQNNKGSKSTMMINSKRKARLVPELTDQQVRVLKEQEKLERSAASIEMKES